MFGFRTALSGLAWRANSRITAEIARNGNRTIMFGLGKAPHMPGWKLPTHPETHYGLPGFRSVILENPRDGASVSLWLKPPADSTKPVFAAFPGRGSGAWLDKGQMVTGTSDPDKRFKILHAMAEEGAGVVAVHPRGTGLSQVADYQRTGQTMPIFNEKLVEGDMKVITSFMTQHGIQPEQTIVMGSSLGSVMAAKLAQSMPKPPAVIALTGGATSMSAYAEALHGGIVDKTIRHLAGMRNREVWYPGKHLGEKMPQELLEEVLKARRSNIKTLEVLKGAVSRMSCNT